VLYEKYYPAMLECGVAVDAFWDLTLLEMEDVIASKNREYRRKEKAKIDNLFLLADALASRINHIFSSAEDRQEPIRQWDVYPELFEKEKDVFEEAKNNLELNTYKEKRMKFAVEHNQKRKEAANGST